MTDEKKARKKAPRGGAAGALPRSSGVLLHVTSLPSPYGIGDLGPPAYRWIDALAKAGQTWWQILPLGPAGAGNSPYQSFSAFAGNAMLISPELLVKDGLLKRSEAAGADLPALPAGRVDFAKVNEVKSALLAFAWDRFHDGAAKELREAYKDFRDEESDWLDDYALFMSLKEAHGRAGWADWLKPLATRDRGAIQSARRELKDPIGRYRFRQFMFFRQLAALREYARGKGVRIIGDLPIYVSPESADAWACAKLFQLDRHRRPKAVAGVPPDYFCATGQRWGNPLYDWNAMKRDGYRWWAKRMRMALRQADLVRLDHFRGFAGYWSIPASHPTAEKGKWRKAPGEKLFRALRKKLGGLPFIAEDLGEITPDVVKLRDRFDLPGMRVLQFAFGGDAGNAFLPHNYVRRSVAYTGTHDNDTTAGWYADLPEEQKARVRTYLSGGSSVGSRAGKAQEARDVAWAMIRLAWSSIADVAIAPLQDVLGLGGDARMNVPGKPNGNWGWRFREEQLTDEVLDWLAEATATYGRVVAK